MSDERPEPIEELERAISRMEDELTKAALTVGREYLPRLRPEDRFDHPFLAGEMDGASHDCVRAGLDGVQGPDGRRLYLAGFALGWDERQVKRAG